MNTQGAYFANGKLLISGEYLILNGAIGLALPLAYGQWMRVKPLETKKGKLYWRANKQNETWFVATYASSGCELIQTSDIMLAERLKNIFKQIKKLNKDFLLDFDVEIVTDLEFLPEWGWGSSSTLISNLAVWTGVNPYQLNEAITGGSGYDIACAWKSSPIFYNKEEGNPKVAYAPFDPPFKDNIIFIHLNKKQQTDVEVKAYKKNARPTQKQVDRISEISQAMAISKNIREFQQLVTEHEYIISEVIDRKTIKQDLFLDFEGTIKSLGAWNGDFIMAVSENDPEKTIDYFKKRGYKVIFPFTKIVKYSA